MATKQAFILAAGLGTRMGALTAKQPKPLLKVGKQSLIVRHVERLKAAGITDIVINHARHGELIENHLGRGEKWAVRLRYVAEGDTPLETAGGVINALPLLQTESFIVLNADIYTDFDFASLPCSPQVAHLVLVDNPPHNSKGDFGLRHNQVVLATGKNATLTYSGIGVYRRDFFTSSDEQRLGALLKQALPRQSISGEHYRGGWIDVGTPQRLQQARKISTMQTGFP